MYVCIYTLKAVPAISDEHEESAPLTADCAATVKLEQLFRAPAPDPPNKSDSHSTAPWDFIFIHWVDCRRGHGPKVARDSGSLG